MWLWENPWEVDEFLAHQKGIWIECFFSSKVRQVQVWLQNLWQTAGHIWPPGLSPKWRLQYPLTSTCPGQVRATVPVLFFHELSDSCLVGILLVVHYNPCLTVWYNHLYTLNNKVFFIAQVIQAVLPFYPRTLGRSPNFWEGHMNSPSQKGRQHPELPVTRYFLRVVKLRSDVHPIYILWLPHWCMVLEMEMFIPLDLRWILCGKKIPVYLRWISSLLSQRKMN